MREPSTMGAVDADPLPAINRKTREPAPAPKPAVEPSGLDASYKAWVDRPSSATFNQTVTAAEPVIRQAATTYAGTHSPLIASRGRILVANAIKSYKPTSGTTLKGWMMQHLQGLSRYRQQLTPIKAPERAMLDLYRMQREAKEHQEEFGEPPDDLELAKRTGFSPLKLHRLRKLNQPVTPESSLLDDEDSPYLPGVGSDSEQAIWAEMVYHDLDSTNRKIYDLLTGRHSKQTYTPSQVASRLGLSVGAISQRTQKIAKLLELGQSLRGN